MNTTDANAKRLQLQKDIANLIISFEKDTQTIVADITYAREEVIGFMNHDLLQVEVYALLTNRTYKK